MILMASEKKIKLAKINKSVKITLGFGYRVAAKPISHSLKGARYHNLKR